MIRFNARSAVSLTALVAGLSAFAAPAAAAVTVTDAGVVVDGAAADAKGGAEPQTTSTSPVSPVSPEDASDASASPGLTEIVVTATKRETNLQKTPIAISVVSQEIITNRHVQSLLDLADGGVPSLRVATFEARQSALTVGIRGIVPFDANQTARDQGVGIYVDGIYLGRQQGLNAALFDVQRIEVLRGPQGTLFGRNAEGGAVSIVTKEPSGEFGGRVIAGVGNYGSRKAEGHIDLPAFGDIAIKLDGLYQHQGPTVKNPLAGAAGFNQYDRVGGRVTAKWTPTTDFTAIVSYDKARDENTPNYSQLINYNPNGKVVGQYDAVTLKLVAPGSPAGTGTVCTACIAPLSPLVFVSGGNRQDAAEIGVPQQPSVDTTEGVAATLKYKLTPEIEIRSITGLRRVSTDQWDNSGGPHRTIFAPNTNFSRYSLSFLKQHQFSQELQLVGSMPQVDWVLGGYYFSEYVQEQAATPSTNKYNVDGTGYTLNSPIVIGPITSSNNGYDRASQFLQRASFANAKSYAAFGQATYTPAGFDMFHLTAGGRYTHDTRTGTLYIVSGVSTNYKLNFSSSRFDPMVTLAFDATPDIHLYAKYASGYRAGGANDRSQSFNAFGPETVKSYEAGAKMSFLDNRVRLNLAGYIMDRKGTQTDFDNVDTRPFLADGKTPNPTFNLHTEDTANAPGVSKIRGFEAELTVRPTEGLTLGAAYAYTSVKVPPTLNPLGVLYQPFTVYTPKHAASFSADYKVPVSSNGAEVQVHLDGNYAGRQYTFQNEPVQADASFVMNGRIALANIRLTDSGTKASLALWSRNLLDTTYIYRRSAANANTLGDYGNFNPPRTFGVEATLNF